MKLYKKLLIPGKHINRTILFGEVDNEEEKNKMFRLRYDVYSKRNYIDSQLIQDAKDIDEYDNNNQCKYFIAKIGEEVIGTIRLIQCTPLPTLKIFSFDLPQVMQKINPEKLCEFGRFVIVPPSKNKGSYLPRGLIMIFMFATLVDYCNNNNLEGGYAFVKKTLLIKLKKFKVPIVLIKNFSEHYPKGGVLEKYFKLPEDPVTPLCFTTESVDNYIKPLISSTRLFSFDNKNEFILKSNLYVKFLKVLKII